jgi:ribonuclease Z
MNLNRARMVIGMVLATASIIAGRPAAAQNSREASDIRVTFLGTGTPTLSLERFSACILVEAAGQQLLFDAGRGCLIRAFQARIDIRTLTRLFITHNHSDHILSLPDLFLTGWTSGRDGPLFVRGPKGTRNMVDHVVQTYQFDVEARVKNGRTPPEVDVQEIASGIVFQQDGIVVRAFDVDHGDIAPAFGYRIDYRGRSVVLSGDTRYSDSLIRAAQGADLLVHEVALGAPGIPPQQQYILAQHTLPDRAAEVFRRVRPKLAVFSHVHLLGGATGEQVMEITKRSYSGRLEMATDLSVADVGEDITFVHGR